MTEFALLQSSITIQRPTPYNPSHSLLNINHHVVHTHPDDAGSVHHAADATSIPAQSLNGCSCKWHPRYPSNPPVATRKRKRPHQYTVSYSEVRRSTVRANSAK